MCRATEKVADLEEKLNKDSHNSSKPNPKSFMPQMPGNPLDTNIIIRFLNGDEKIHSIVSSLEDIYIPANRSNCTG